MITFKVHLDIVNYCTLRRRFVLLGDMLIIITTDIIWLPCLSLRNNYSTLKTSVFKYVANKHCEIAYSITFHIITTLNVVKNVEFLSRNKQFSRRY